MFIDHDLTSQDRVLHCDYDAGWLFNLSPLSMSIIVFNPFHYEVNSRLLEMECSLRSRIKSVNKTEIK